MNLKVLATLLAFAALTVSPAETGQDSDLDGLENVELECSKVM